VAEGLPLRVYASELQALFNAASKWWQNRLELLESVYVLAPAGKVVLIPGVALSLYHLMLAKIIFLVWAPYDQDCVDAP
jgi:hypothetical protein